jgi:HSP90 family molecular chaperone
MPQQAEAMKFQAEIYQLMTPIINTFHEKKKFFLRTHLKIFGYM